MPGDLPKLRARLREVAQFSTLPDAAIDALIEDSEERAFAAGARMLSEGEASDSAFAILSGHVRVFVGSGDDEAELAQLPAPALVGEIGALAGMERTASVSALTEVTALRIDAEVLLDVAARVPRLPLTVVRQLGRQVRNVNRAIALYTHSISALDSAELSPDILDALTHPAPELAGFANTFRRMAERIRTEHQQHAELSSASMLQQSLLPRNFSDAPLKGRAEIAAEMIPARQVGGDFFDIFMFDDDRLGVLIGDVCGKGVPAALFMAVSLTVLRLVAGEESDLARIVTRANRLLCAQNAGEMFATVFLGALDLRTGRLDFADCGHLPPLLVKGDSASPLKAAGVPLGIFPDFEFSAASASLKKGDALLLYSDGVTEAANEAGEEFGEERLMALAPMLASRKPREMILKALEAVEDFSGPAGRADDTTLIALRRL